MTDLLSKINIPADIKHFTIKELKQLATEIRNFIIETVATKEGHLGASLGVVELTIALHYVFDTPNDKLIWDVGHQAYGHKILTGRREAFATNRQKNGISGFPKISESEYDAFGVGHSSTAISAALGMALGAALKGEENRNHIAIVGDASIASGMAFEGLNHAGATDANIIVVLNDNAIGIDPSVGALKSYLTNVKSGKNPRANNMIKSLNINYSGPLDGHDLTKLITVLKRLKNKKGPKFLHIITTKGKGLRQAEENQIVYHAPGKFDSKTGEILSKDIRKFDKYQDVFGLTLKELADNNDKIYGITPAMPTGSSLKYMMEAHPKRAIDVGIAEQHAVTLSAGLATEGFVVYCTIYSTFLQRAYDQIIHDVCLQNLPVIFCVDRAGLVGEDGATHQGVFDISFLNVIPNIQILAPKDAIELRNTLYSLQYNTKNPVAVRYPRGEISIKKWQIPFQKIAFDHVECIKEGKNTAILSTGTILKNVEKALEKKPGNNFSIYHFIQIKPLNIDALETIFAKYQKIITIEEGAIIGGFGSMVSQFASEYYPKTIVINKGIPDIFIEHATVYEQELISQISEDYLNNFFSTLP